MKHWNSIHEIKAANKAFGKFFFSPGAMRFFASIVYPRVYGGRFFVTSEKAPYEPRKYCIRMATDEGDIETIGPFNELPSLSVARSIVRGFLAGKATCPSANGAALQVWEALLKLRAQEQGVSA